MSEQAEAIAAFIERVERLEKRYKNDRFATSWLMPREMLSAVRDRLKYGEQRELFEVATSDAGRPINAGRKRK
jgi:hypothetical protein